MPVAGQDWTYGLINRPEEIVQIDGPEFMRRGRSELHTLHVSHGWPGVRAPSERVVGLVEGSVLGKVLRDTVGKRHVNKPFCGTAEQTHVVYAEGKQPKIPLTHESSQQRQHKELLAEVNFRRQLIGPELRNRQPGGTEHDQASTAIFPGWIQSYL